MAELLSYLSSKSENDSKLDEVVEEQKTPQPYHHMLEWFWQGFSSVCLGSLQSVVGKVVKLSQWQLFESTVDYKLKEYSYSQQGVLLIAEQIALNVYKNMYV